MTQIPKEQWEQTLLATDANTNNIRLVFQVTHLLLVLAADNRVKHVTHETTVREGIFELMRYLRGPLLSEGTGGQFIKALSDTEHFYRELTTGDAIEIEVDTVARVIFGLVSYLTVEAALLRGPEAVSRLTDALGAKIKDIGTLSSVMMADALTAAGMDTEAARRAVMLRYADDLAELRRALTTTPSFVMKGALA